MQVALFGDIGGHLHAFEAGLDLAGVDVDGRSIPEDLVVCQVGDLVHKGPDSDALVSLADELLAANPNRYIQLLGNHEAQYLDGPWFWDDTPLTDETVATLRRWYETTAAQVALALRLADKTELLVTHAGLTEARWRTACKSEPDVAKLASGLNRAALQSPGWSFDHGVMLMTGQRTTYADPLHASSVWAEPIFELYPGWSRLREPAPFGQIHGHASAMRWSSQRSGRPAQLSWSARDVLGDTLHVDIPHRHYRVELAAAPFWGIDPGFGNYDPARPAYGLMLDATVLPAPAIVPTYPANPVRWHRGGRRGS